MGLAFFFRSNKCINVLLDRGVDVMFKPLEANAMFFGATYLHWAAANGNAEHVKKLLDLGVNKLHFDKHCALPWYYNKWGWPEADRWPSHNDEVYELLAVPTVTDQPGPHHKQLRALMQVTGGPKKVFGMTFEEIAEMKKKA